MKIGIDASPLIKNRTGVGNYVYPILLRLVENKEHEFYLYSNQDIHFPSSSNVKTITHSPKRKGVFWQNTQLLKSLREDEIDVFWATNSYAPVMLPTNTVLVTTVHDLVYEFAGSTMPLISRYSRKIFQPMTVNKSDAIVSVSKSTADSLYELSRKNSTVVHPLICDYYRVIDSQLSLKALKAKYGLDSYLLTLGTLEPRKNISALLKVYSRLIEEGYELPQLALAGGKGWKDSDLSELVARGVDAKWLIMLGFVPEEEMNDLYRGATAFIFPSVYEGFGMPVLEAQACGAPVLISDIPSLNEASDGIACKFKPDDEGIRKCLIELAQSELPLVCRVPTTIDRDLDATALAYSKLMGL